MDTVYGKANVYQGLRLDTGSSSRSGVIVVGAFLKFGHLHGVDLLLSPHPWCSFHWFREENRPVLQRYIRVVIGVA